MVDPNVPRDLKDPAADLSAHRCRQLSVEDLRNYDLIVVMDRRNYIDVIDLARVWLLEEKVRRKLVLLLDANFRSRAGSKQSARHAGGGAGAAGFGEWQAGGLRGFARRDKIASGSV